MNNNNDGKNYVDYNLDYNYVLQWIEESRMARDSYQLLLYRMTLALQGKPWKNLYQEELTSNINKIHDEAVRKSCESSCTDVPEGHDFSILKALQNRANQMASGVDTYQYEVNDPYMIIDAETEDLLAAKCEQDYQLNNLGILASTFSRDLTAAAITAVEVRYDPITDKNKVFRIAPKNVFFDTKYSSTGQERFRGYNMMISWKKLKKMIADNPNDEVNLNLKAPDRSIITEDGKHIDKTAKYSNRKIRTLNGLDIYVDTMNKLAMSSELARDADSYKEFRHDLLDCYNVNWYRSYATDPKAETNNGYGGDDVELTVMYDMINKIEFKIINRRYVVSANSKSFHRKVLFPVKNPVTGEITYRIDDFCLPCPLKIQYEVQENRDISAFPISTAMKLLDIHDRLCAWDAKRRHVANILSILRVETNGGDAASLRGLMNIMGIVLDDIQGDINTVNFAYDWTAIDSEMQRLRDEIKSTLAGYDDFDAMQMMGDRASAAEAGTAVGAVAQGLATHQNAIMQLYADIARQCIANRVAYSPEQEFSVVNNGEYRTLTVQQMALTATISVKSKLSKRIQEKMLAANAMTLVGQLGSNNLINKKGLAYLISQAMYGNAPRKMIESFLNDPQPTEAEQQTAQLEAQNMAAQLAQNEQAYQRNPVQYEADEVMNNPENSPEDIDAIIASIREPEGAGDGSVPPTAGTGVGRPQDDLSESIENPEGMTMDLSALGQAPEVAGEMANTVA